MNTESVISSLKNKVDEKAAEKIASAKLRMAEKTGIPRTHPKFDRAWDIAWQMGHSAGISEVEGIFMEIADLLKP